MAVLASFALSLPAGPAEGAPGHASVSPGFSLPDVRGKVRTLAGFRGRPVVLLLFCGCDPCHQCAEMWGQVQQSGTLSQDAGRHGPPATVVVYQGDAGAARAFAAQTGLDAGTVLLTDPTDRVAGLYHAPVCPRVFVLDAHGTLRYTNDEPGSDPQRTPAAAVTSRVVTALHLIGGPSVSPQKSHTIKETPHHG